MHEKSGNSGWPVDMIVGKTHLQISAGEEYVPFKISLKKPSILAKTPNENTTLSELSFRPEYFQRTSPGQTARDS